LALGGGELGLGVGSLPSFAEGATSKAAFRLAISLSFARLANGGEMRTRGRHVGVFVPLG
jgi:hypothetical protein